MEIQQKTNPGFWQIRIFCDLEVRIWNGVRKHTNNFLRGFWVKIIFRAMFKTAPEYRDIAGGGWKKCVCQK